MFLIVLNLGVGLLLGLLVGTLLYVIGGYFLPFIVYWALMLTVTPLAVLLVPAKLKHDEQQPIITVTTANDIEVAVKGTKWL